MGTRADQLRSEIEKTRADLAGHASELRAEASRAARKAAVVVGAVTALWIGSKIVRAILRRSKD